MPNKPKNPPPPKDPEKKLGGDEGIIELTPSELKILALKEKIAGLEGRVFAHVYVEINAKKVKRGKIPAERVLADSDIIAKQFGGGEYIVEFMLDGDFMEGGRNIEYSFDPAFYPPPASSSVAPANSQDSLVISLLKGQVDMLNKIVEKTIEVRGPAASAQQQLDQVFALVDRMKNTGPAGAVEVEGNRALKEIISAGFSAIRKNDADKPEGGMSAVERIAVSLFESLAPVAQAALAKTAGVKMQRLPAPGGNGSKPEELDMDSMVKMLAKKALPEILEMAKAGKSAEEAAKLALEKIPSEYDETIWALVDRADVAEYLAGIDAGIIPYKIWVNDVAKKIKESFKEVPA